MTRIGYLYFSGKPPEDKPQDTPRPVMDKKMTAHQASLFEHGEDMPLFSGTPQHAQDKTFTPASQPQQLSWAKCKLCQDTGTVKDNGTTHYCTCEAGLQLRAKVFK